MKNAPKKTKKKQNNHSNNNNKTVKNLPINMPPPKKDGGQGNNRQNVAKTNCGPRINPSIASGKTNFRKHNVPPKLHFWCAKMWEVASQVSR